MQKPLPTADNIRNILDQMNQAFEEERSLRFDLEEKVNALYKKNLYREQ